MVSLIHLTSDSHDDSHLCNSAAGPVDDYHLVTNKLLFLQRSVIKFGMELSMNHETKMPT